MPDGAISRRQMLAGGLLGLAPVALAQEGRGAAGASVPRDSAAARLFDPFRVGRPRDRITDYENDPFIVGVENRLRCTCGCNLNVYTCRTTDFNCATSPRMHREVVRLVEEGRTAEEILDAFIAQHGEMVLMAPKKEGFNLAGYFVPGLTITLVGAVLLGVLARRHRRAAAVVAAEPADVTGLTDADRATLESELRDLER